MSILDTLPSSQSINDWANAVIDVMTINFDKYFKSNSDKFVGPLKCTSPNRYNVFNELLLYDKRLLIKMSIIFKYTWSFLVIESLVSDYVH